MLRLRPPFGPCPFSMRPIEGPPEILRGWGVGMPLLVMKFGGTSVADIDRIANAARKVQREVDRGYDVIVIVSAMSGKTNELVGWVEGTSRLYDAREYDAVVASGENVTAGLMALRLQEMGVPARSWQGWQVPINTTAQHGSARFVSIPRDNLDAKFAEGMKVAVVALSLIHI